jgi:hypothetical protein
LVLALTGVIGGSIEGFLASDPEVQNTKEVVKMAKKSRGGRMTAAKKRAAKRRGGKGPIAKRRAGRRIMST